MWEKLMDKLMDKFDQADQRVRDRACGAEANVELVTLYYVTLHLRDFVKEVFTAIS